jgi:UDP-glucose 4-epimerase
MAKAIVTGGAGFIGSNLVDALIKEGHQVTIIDDLSTGRKENLNPRAKFHLVDIRSVVVDKIFQEEKPDYLFHLAAQMNVRASVEDPKFDADVNIRGGINLLQSAKKHNVKKAIFASTGGAIYGEQDYFPADEEHPARPVSPYGVSKLSFEKYLHYFQVEYGLEYVSLRYANVYGPRQSHLGEAGVVAIFYDRLLAGKDAIINGDGKQTRDYVYVDDVIRVNLAAMFLTSELAWRPMLTPSSTWSGSSPVPLRRRSTALPNPVNRKGASLPSTGHRRIWVGSLRSLWTRD